MTMSIIMNQHNSNWNSGYGVNFIAIFASIANSTIPWSSMRAWQISKSLGVVYDTLYESLCVKNLAPSQEGNSVQYIITRITVVTMVYYKWGLMSFFISRLLDLSSFNINFTFNCNNLSPVIYSFLNQNFQRVILHRACLSSSKTDIMLDRCLRAWKNILKSVYVH